MPKSESILLLNPGPRARVIIPTNKGRQMATKKKSKKGKMPAALKAYWARMRENPKKKRKTKPAKDSGPTLSSPGTTTKKKKKVPKKTAKKVTFLPELDQSTST